MGAMMQREVLTDFPLSEDVRLRTASRLSKNLPGSVAPGNNLELGLFGNVRY